MTDVTATGALPKRPMPTPLASCRFVYGKASGFSHCVVVR